MHDNKAFVALGANLPSAAGTPICSLKAVLSDLQACPGLKVQSVSRFFMTPAYPPGSGPDYANACVQLQSSLAPQELLQILHRAEDRLGRLRDNGRWGARTLDLDLLAMGDAILPDPQTVQRWRDLSPDQQLVRAPSQLILPHPRLHERAFVLVPLADIAGDWRHPATGQTLSEMLDRLPRKDRDAIRPIFAPGR